MIKKIKITETLQHDIKWELHGETIPAAIAYLTELAEIFGDKPTFDMGYDDDGCAYLSLITTRLETDDELANRLQVEASYREENNKQLEIDRATYRALRAKLGYPDDGK